MIHNLQPKNAYSIDSYRLDWRHDLFAIYLREFQQRVLCKYE